MPPSASRSADAVPRRLRLSRSAAVLRLQRRLQDDGWPRAQMLLLVALTAGCGLLASWLLLHLGLHRMALRYPLALLLAYLGFLGLLGLWLRSRAGDGLSWPDLPTPSSDGGRACNGAADAPLPPGTRWAMPTSW